MGVVRSRTASSGRPICRNVIRIRHRRTRRPENHSRCEYSAQHAAGESASQPRRSGPCTRTRHRSCLCCWCERRSDPARDHHLGCWRAGPFLRTRTRDVGGHGHLRTRAADG